MMGVASEPSKGEGAGVGSQVGEAGPSSLDRGLSPARNVRLSSPPWLDRLDFSSLEMVPAHYVSGELEQRESDVVWRLRYGPSGDWFYVYLLIEFQSSVDRFMAIRVLTYLMLLYEDLILKKRLTRSGKLPPVVPIVLYNGTRKWTAPVQVAVLVESLPGYEAHLPRFEGRGVCRRSSRPRLSTSAGSGQWDRLIDRAPPARAAGYRSRPRCPGPPGALARR